MAILRRNCQVESPANLVVIVRELYWSVRLGRGDAVELSRVIVGLEVGEFQAACGRNDENPPVPLDFSALGELDEGGQRNPGVRAREHSRAVGSCDRVSEFLLARLFDQS